VPEGHRFAMIVMVKTRNRRINQTPMYNLALQDRFVP